jgi:hypothetical protein
MPGTLTDHWVSTASLISKPDLVMCWIIMAIWLGLDGVVVGVSVVHDSSFFRYLTNQVWTLGVVSKLVLCVDMLKLGTREIRLTGLTWFTVTLFLLFGIMQGAVFVTFFVLVTLDDKILDEARTDQRHTLAEIVVWNNLRHVTPVLMHLAMTRSLRGYIASVTWCGYPTWWGESNDAGKYTLALTATSLILGLIHTAIFDDAQLYRYADPKVGARCQLVFGLTCAVSSVFVTVVAIGSKVVPDHIEHGASQGVEDVDICPMVQFSLPGGSGTSYPPSREDRTWFSVKNGDLFGGKVRMSDNKKVTFKRAENDRCKLSDCQSHLIRK